MNVKWCRILISSRNGMLSFYALILMVILGFLLSGLQTAAVDHNLNCRLALFEAQARQGADSGLNICLRVAGDHPVDGIISSITFQTGAVASMTIWFHTGQAVLDPTTMELISQASSTAMVFERGPGGQEREVARKSVRNTINVLARTFGQAWSR